MAASSIQQVRALADNRRLWMMVSDLLRDPGNALPEPSESLDHFCRPDSPARDGSEKLRISTS